MKWNVVFFLFLCALRTFGQDNKDPWFETQGLELVVSVQNEDIFSGFGFYFKPYDNWMFHGDVLLGVRRTFFQSAPFWWISVSGHRDFIKKENIFFGPSARLGTGFVELDKDVNVQNYYDVLLGYHFSIGNEIRFFQSSYYGIRQLNLHDKSKGRFFPGYSFQIGMQYDL